MKMESAECIYIQRLDGEKDGITVRKDSIAGMTVLNIQQYVKNNEEGRKARNFARLNRMDKSLSKILKKYYWSDAAIIANEKILRDFKLSNVLFEARKQEFLCNMSKIRFAVQQCGKQKAKRSSCMLILDSLAWSRNEMAEIIKEMKNGYEDIYIVVKKTTIDIEEMSAFFFNEYGVVLYLLSDSDGRQQRVEMVFLFVEEWCETVREYVYEKGYVIAEWENNMVRYEKGKTGGRELYSGFRYEYNHCEVPYEIAVMLLYSSFVRKKMIQETHDFSISSVANCLVE